MNEMTMTGELILAARLPLDQHPVAVYLAGLSKGSAGTMRQALDKIAAIISGGHADCLTVNWSAMRYQHTTAVRARLAESYAPATANKMLSALRGVLKAAWRLGQMDSEAYRRAVDVQGVKGKTLRAGRHIAQGELVALMTACCDDPSPAGIRDAAIIAVAYSCGLRRAELVTLDVEDIDLDAGELRVTGKGRKARLTYAANGAAEALSDWLEVRGDEPGALFCPIRKNGAIQHRRMTNQAVHGIMKRRAQQAGVSNVTPHDFRRTFAGDLLDAGADLSVVQQLMGHASPTTTAQYDRRPERVKRKAAEKLHVPYYGRSR